MTTRALARKLAGDDLLVAAGKKRHPDLAQLQAQWEQEHDDLRRFAESHHKPNSRYRSPADYELPDHLPVKGWANSGIGGPDGVGFTFNMSESPSKPEIALLSDVVSLDEVKHPLKRRQAEKMLAKLRKTYGDKPHLLADRLREWLSNNGGCPEEVPTTTNGDADSQVRQRGLFDD